MLINEEQIMISVPNGLSMGRGKDYYKLEDKEILKDVTNWDNLMESLKSLGQDYLILEEI